MQISEQENEKLKCEIQEASFDPNSPWFAIREDEENRQKKNEYFGDPVYTYDQDKAVEDGFLADNPRKDAFPECSIITNNLYEKIKKVAFERSLKRVFEISDHELIGCLMVGAKEMYDKGVFADDQDKNFFVMPATEEGVIVWFVRNEKGKLTAMLPEDY